MAGGSLNLTYGISCANIWFTAYADFLISWDPFYYNIGIGISVGASVSIRICFFGCVNIGISISIGATLTIVGPPLHGSVSVNLDVCSVTIPFGPDPNPQPNYITDSRAVRWTTRSWHAGRAVEADQRVLLPVRYEHAGHHLH